MNDLMLLETITKYSVNWFNKQYEQDVPGSIPFVTGNLILDHFLHHMAQDYGIKVTVEDGRLYPRIETVEIIDIEKATWFALRWA